MPTSDPNVRRRNARTAKERFPQREAERKKRYREDQKAFWPDHPEPNRTEAARELLRQYPYMTTPEVARAVGVDEKAVRRARKTLGPKPWGTKAHR